MLQRPLLVVACLALSACAQGVGGYRQLAPSLAEPAAEAVDTRGTYLDLIQRMQKQGAYYASLAHIEAFRQRHGDSAALRLLQADALRETGQLDAAGQLYDGLTRGEQAASAWHGIGLIAARRDQDSKAEAALARAAQLTPLDTAVLGDLGFARLRAGQLEQAQAPLAQALELAPGDARAVANLAVWALLRNDPGTAERLLQQGNATAVTRAEVQRQAIALRQRHAATSAAISPTLPPSPIQATAVTATAARLPRRISADTASVAAVVQSTEESRDPSLPGTMLERFGKVATANESTP